MSATISDNFISVSAVSGFDEDDDDRLVLSQIAEASILPKIISM